MKLSATDIIFIIFALAMVSLLIWEMIPDGLKAYWKYVRQTRKEQGTKWAFTFRR